MMTINEYQAAALKTESPAQYELFNLDRMKEINTLSTNYPRVLQGIMGLVGEAGECDDYLKKHLFQGHEFDHRHLAKELGDVAWYIALAADAIGYDLETILKMNIDKLRNRYPSGFEPKRSLVREDGDD